MKKLIVGVFVVVVGFLAVAGPASAQGMADPLGLIASGAIVPFWSTGDDTSILEIASPVGDNTTTTPAHLVFFNASCTRGESANLSLTANDLAVTVLDDFVANAFNGLVAIGGSTDGINLNALKSPIHVRVLRFNIAQDFFRFYDPISAHNAEENVHNWNPLRSGATLPWAPLAGGVLSTTLEFVCPTGTVGGATTAPFGAWPSGVPANPTIATTIQGRVFDLAEKFLRDISTTCTCLTVKNVTELSTIYSNATEAPAGTYTELLGNGAFVAYRAIRFDNGTITLDGHGRLHNANTTSLGGTLTGGVR